MTTPQFTGKDAADALAQASNMTAVGRARTHWPRWAAALDAAVLGVTWPLLMFGFITTPSDLSLRLMLIAMPIAILGIVFRFWMRKRVDLAKPRWSDGGLNLFYWLVMGVAVIGARYAGWMWAPWVVTPGLVALHYLLRRRGRVV